MEGAGKEIYQHRDVLYINPLTSDLTPYIDAINKYTGKKHRVLWWEKCGIFVEVSLEQGAARIKRQERSLNL